MALAVCCLESIISYHGISVWMFHFKCLCLEAKARNHQTCWSYSGLYGPKWAIPVLDNPAQTSTYVGPWCWYAGQQKWTLLNAAHWLNQHMLGFVCRYAGQPTLWQRFGKDPFLSQPDCTPVHKASSITTWFDELSAEKLQWPAPELGPQPHWTPLAWIGTLIQDSIWPHKCSFDRVGTVSLRHDCFRKPFQDSGGCYCCQRWWGKEANPYQCQWNWNVQQAYMVVMFRCPHTFGHSVSYHHY